MCRIVAGLWLFVWSAAFAQAEPVILIFGDSLSSGYGLSRGESWVELLQARLQSEAYPHRVVNASISGETTSGGRSRIDSTLKKFRPSVVIIELGGNDGLRGSNVTLMQANLDYMISAAKKTKARVLLLGMQMPPNYGSSYTREFAASFAHVAKKHQISLVPFFLEGIGERLDYFLADRIHPNAAAQSILLNNVWPALRPLLGKR